MNKIERIAFHSYIRYRRCRTLELSRRTHHAATIQALDERHGNSRLAPMTWSVRHYYEQVDSQERYLPDLISFLMITPFFITKTTFSITLMSRNGSASTAMMSANLPGSIVP